MREDMLRLNVRNVFTIAIILGSMWLAFFSSLNIVYRVLAGVVFFMAMMNWLLYLFVDEQK